MIQPINSAIKNYCRCSVTVMADSHTEPHSFLLHNTRITDSKQHTLSFLLTSPYLAYKLENVSFLVTMQTFTGEKYTADIALQIAN